MKKNIIIVGAGGLGKEVYSYLIDDISKGFISDTIKGFIDDNDEQIFSINNLYLGKIKEYMFSKNDYAIVAIANVDIRNKIITYLQNKEINFYKFIHSSVFISKDSSVGKGTIVCPNSIIQANSKIGENCIINIFSSVGHDSVVGNFCVFSPYTTLNGNVQVGNSLFTGTRVTILLGSFVGNNCIISASTTVKGLVKDNFMVKDKVNQVQVQNRLITQKGKK